MSAAPAASSGATLLMRRSSGVSGRPVARVNATISAIVRSWWVVKKSGIAPGADVGRRD
jgi:hypothetical protein